MIKVEERKVLHRYQIIPKREIFIFDKFSYNEEFFTGILTKDEYFSIIVEVNKKISLSNEFKKRNDEIVLPKSIKILTLLSWLFSIISLILLSFVIKSPKNNGNLFILSFVFLGISILITIALTLYNFFRKINEFKNLYQIIDEQLSLYFSIVNAHYKHNFEFKYILGKNVIDIRIFEAQEEIKKSKRSHRDGDLDEFDESDSYSDSDSEENKLDDKIEENKENNIEIKKNHTNIPTKNDMNKKTLITTNQNHATFVSKDKLIENKTENCNLVSVVPKTQNNITFIVDEEKALNETNHNSKTMKISNLKTDLSKKGKY